MLGSTQVWIIICIIISFSTLTTGYYFFLSENGQSSDKHQIRDIMNRYNSLKLSIEELKWEKFNFTLINETDSGQRVTKFLRSFNQKGTIKEILENGNISMILYDVDGDGREDVIEYYERNPNFPVRQEFDINSDGYTDVSMRDINDDGIIDANELNILLEGKFIPFSSFSTIIM